jgi:hypothetical protein
MLNRDRDRTDATDSYEPIDSATSATICKAIGGRLRQNLAPEPSGLPPRLQHLLEQLLLRDSRGSPDPQ